MPNSESNTTTAPVEGAQPSVLSAALEARAASAGENGAGSKFHSLEPHAPSAVAEYAIFDDFASEIDALFHGVGILDLGSRAKIRITGEDRVRWLNGMVTNTVQSLPQDEGNYTFVLNAQGRIQGDFYVYRRADDILLDTSREQVPALLSHLEHYIIMDDVELAEVSNRWTALGLAGPRAPEIIAAIIAGRGIAFPPSASPTGNARLLTATIGTAEIMVVEAYHVSAPRYELWIAPQDVLTVWDTLRAAGARPAGWKAGEVLRVLEGTPLYGIDLNDRDLPQETNQSRALNFTKGCYLGQEIVERIRSRGKVHRKFRQFRLQGGLPPLPFDLTSADQVVGRITSATSLSAPELSGVFALGFVREESVERGAPIEYEGGTATPLEAPISLHPIF